VTRSCACSRHRDRAVIASRTRGCQRWWQARTGNVASGTICVPPNRLGQTEMKLDRLETVERGNRARDHEPLNLVNNFSAIRRNKTDAELNDARKAPPDRQEDERKSTNCADAKENLEKVGPGRASARTPSQETCCCPRAEGLGEQQTGGINAILDDSLNAGLSRARAEKPGFNITLQRDSMQRPVRSNPFPRKSQAHSST